MGTHILIHLHPDFFHELRDVLTNWNKIQNRIEFVGLRPRHDLEVSLLESGAISHNEASKVADGIRKDTKFTSDAGTVVFTEKRLYDDRYDELFVSGTESDEKPPNIAILSLQFLRNLYSRSSEKTLMFRAVVSNILFSLGVDIGLGDHRSDPVGCIMDFCDNMRDIEKCLVNGPKFCSECAEFLTKRDETFLLDLVDSFLQTPSLESKDKDVTETILLREEMRKKTEDSFRYDIALSFSSSDRTYAETLANALIRLNVKVFYDKFEQAKLWGKNLQIYLTDLYRLRAKYCVVLLSKNYKESRWTNQELKAILSRAFEANEDYILPIRLDDSEIPGILPTRAYINWHEETLDGIVDLIHQKLCDYQQTPGTVTYH